jgi:DNA-binding response OmpR family regulator
MGLEREGAVVAVRILVAEDDAKQANLIRMYLERDGHQVHVVGDGRAVLDRCQQRPPDLLVLDVMMPRLDGLDVCRILRADPNPITVPILLITARTTEEDVLLGLNLGADDYLTKPYSPRILVARARALLRRAQVLTSGESPPISVGDVIVNPTRFEVQVAGRPVRLTAKEFGLLEVLAGTPHRVFTRAELIDRAFGFDHEVLERTVDAHVMNLRRKLGANRIQTVYGRGYKFTGNPTR